MERLLAKKQDGRVPRKERFSNMVSQKELYKFNTRMTDINQYIQDRVETGFGPLSIWYVLRLRLLKEGRSDEFPSYEKVRPRVGYLNRLKEVKDVRLDWRTIQLIEKGYIPPYNHRVEGLIFREWPLPFIRGTIQSKMSHMRIRWQDVAEIALFDAERQLTDLQEGVLKKARRTGKSVLDILMGEEEASDYGS